MRVIIIEDKDGEALLDSLRLESMQQHNVLREDCDKPPTMSDMHRAFHFVVVRWLQSQGWKSIR